MVHADGCCGTGIPNGGGGGTGGTSSGGTGGTSSGGTLKFGYPFGDKSTSPAGGSPWRMFQVLGHYWEDWKGVHLAQDIGGGAAFSPVYAVADGLVRVSTTNTSSYKNVVLLEHDMGDGTKICSFYAHLDSRTVQTGQTVTRGQQIATLMDQGTNTHLHYFFARPALCDRIANLNGAGACGYDGATSNPGVLHSDLSTEPPTYTAVGTDQWGCSAAGYEFISPSQFIDQHHF